MPHELKPIRRVVTGHDEKGRSRVVWDGPAPNVKAPAMGSGRRYTDLWVWNDPVPPLDGDSDDGNLSYDFPGPPRGGHLRVVQADPQPKGDAKVNPADIVPLHAPKVIPPGRMWDRGGSNAYSSPMHKTETIDYAICLAGERILVLDDGEVAMRPGDVTIQVGAYHQWTCPQGALMAFDMMAAHFVDGADGLGQGNDQPISASRGTALPPGVRPTRRIVTIDREPGRSSLVSDGPAPDVRIDPARPGFASARLWVTDAAPAKVVFETLHLPHTLEPPPNGSVMRVMTVPPDDAWKGKVGAREVEAFFLTMGSPGASAYAPRAPHPYTQKTRTLDFCIVVEGEVVLILDTQEVALKAGEVVIQRGTRHAWSNRSGAPAQIAIASHDAR
jgi:mannose-6-phosphate isomerase-like protein (cupin superfamily)